MTEADITTQPYKLKISEIIRLRWLLYYYRTLVRWPPGFYHVVMLVMPLLIAVADRASFALAALYLLASLVFWLVVVPLLDLLTRYLSSRKTWNQSFQCITILTPAEVVLRSDAPDLRQNWSLYRGVLFMDESIVLLTHASGGHLIKPEAFAGDADRQAFLKLARRRIREANHRQVGVFAAEPEQRDELSGLKTRPFAMTFGVFATQYAAAWYRIIQHPISLIILIAGLAALAGWQMDHMRHGYTFIGPLPLMLGLIVLVVPLTACLMVFFAWRQAHHKGLDIERVVAVAPHGLHTRSHQFDIQLPWQSIRDITRFGGCSIFWINAQAGFPVPVSAFADKAAADAFHVQALVWWKAAKAVSAETPGGTP